MLKKNGVNFDYKSGYSFELNRVFFHISVSRYPYIYYRPEISRNKYICYSFAGIDIADISSGFNLYLPTSFAGKAGKHSLCYNGIDVKTSESLH
jgi:hypothetical protein